MSEHDFVDVGGRDAGIGERAGRDAHDQALDGFALELSERRMGPSDDAVLMKPLLTVADSRSSWSNFGRFPPDWQALPEA